MSLADDITKMEFDSVTGPAKPFNFFINWTITNFSFRKNQLEEVQSERYVVGESEWFLVSNPLTKKVVAGREVVSTSLFIRHAHLGRGPYKVQANVVYSVIDSTTGQAIRKYTRKTDRMFDNPQANDWGFVNYLPHENIFNPAEKILTDDKLMFRVDVEYISLLEPARRPTIRSEFNRRAVTLVRRMRECDIGRDFVLVSNDGTERKVHRAVLNASSPVFEAMFASGMNECLTGRCEMTDVSTEAMNTLIMFLYMTSVDVEISENAEDVLMVADKYQIGALKKECESVLVTKLNAENASKMFMLGEQYSAGVLRNAALRFLVSSIPPSS